MRTAYGVNNGKAGVAVKRYSPACCDVVDALE
jgi:hypothetical protein